MELSRPPARPRLYQGQVKKKSRGLILGAPCRVVLGQQAATPWRTDAAGRRFACAAVAAIPAAHRSGDGPRRHVIKAAWNASPVGAAAASFRCNDGSESISFVMMISVAPFHSSASAGVWAHRASSAVANRANYQPIAYVSRTRSWYNSWRAWGYPNACNSHSMAW